MPGDVIIRRQRISITTSNEKLAFECRQFADESLTDNLIKMYKKLFHQGSSSDDYIIIDSLKVDLGEISSQDFKYHFFELFEEKLGIELRRQFETISNSNEFEEEAGQDSGPIYAKENQQNCEALFVFLQSGLFPWWYQKRIGKSPRELLSDFSGEEQTKFLIYLVTKLRSLTTDAIKKIVKRLFIHLQSSAHESYLIELSDLFSEQSLKNNIQTIIHQKEYFSKLFEISLKDFYEHAMAFVLLTPSPADFIRELLLYLKQSSPISTEEFELRVKEQIIKDNEQTFKDLNLKQTIEDSNIEPTEDLNIEPTIEDMNIKPKHNSSKNLKARNEKLLPTSKQHDKTPWLDKGLYISNAGLVILHPFLPAFFKSLNLLNDENQFVSKEAQNKAAVLLYYLQYSEQEYKEWEMPLNKIICGLETEDLIPDDIVLNDLEKEETIALLQSVIENWTALKGASIEALQSTFLIRDGKVTFKDNYWLIQVERTGVDILLDRLPWGINVIKLPWIKELMYIEW